MRVLADASRKPFADAESPRTRRMWEEYEEWDFPSSGEDVQMEGSLHRFVVHTRIRG